VPDIFDLIYKGMDGIKVDFAMAPRSPRPNETWKEAANSGGL
jgi:hypothetical protein